MMNNNNAMRIIEIVRRAIEITSIRPKSILVAITLDANEQSIFDHEHSIILNDGSEYSVFTNGRDSISFKKETTK